MVIVSAAAPLTILESILAWSADRPEWQRDALRRIVQQGKLGDRDIAELATLCLAEHGLVQPGGLAALPLEQKHLPAHPGATNSVTLSGMRNISGVNHLAPGQNLTFSAAGLTIVYGANGSGKSGYARILKRICRTRNPGAEILTNIYATAGVSVPQQATIDYAVGVTAEKPLVWSDTGIPHPVLSAVGIFDSSCTAVHIGSKNEIAARPFGLDIPDELADVSKRLEERFTGMKRQQESTRHAIFAAPPWKTTTAVGKAVAALNAESDLASFRALGQLTVDEQMRNQQLKEDLARDPEAAARQIRLRIGRIRSLSDNLHTVEDTLSDTNVAAVQNLHHGAIAAREAARVSAESLFSSQPLAGVGEPVWRELWESARRYSETRAYLERPFPPAEPGLHCLLCQQPLTHEAASRMRSFEDFVCDDTETMAQTKERAAREKLRPLLSLDLLLRQQAAGLDEIASEGPALRTTVVRFLATARLRRFTCIRSLHSSTQVASLAANPASQLDEVIQRLEMRATELDQLIDPIARRRCEQERDELEDRGHLAASISLVESEHLRLLTVALLEFCAKDFATTAITNLGNKLAQPHRDKVKLSRRGPVLMAGLDLIAYGRI